MFGLTIRRATLSLRAKSILLITLMTGLSAGSALSGDIDKFDPATTDPDLFRIAVGHSSRLKVPSKGARMEIRMTDRKTRRVIRKKEVFLQQTEWSKETMGNLPKGKHEVISVYRIPERQISELRALQAKFLALPKDEQDGIAGSLSIDVSGCKVDPDDDGQMLISTFMKTSEIKDFILLAKDYDLRNVPSGNGQTSEDTVLPCP